MSGGEVLISAVTVFVLAIFVGFEIIAKVPPLLHTPLMSGSNAISGITVIGAIVAVAAGSTPALTLSPFKGIQTMTGFMLQIGLGDADRGSIEYEALFAVGAMLFLMTLIFNVAAQVLVRRFQEQYE